MISKPLIDANTAKRMPTSAVQLLHQSSYLDFNQTHLTLISYVRLISFELHKLLNSLRRKPFVEQFILFRFYKIIQFIILSFNISLDLSNFVYETIISVKIVKFYVKQKNIELVKFLYCMVSKFINLVYIF